MEEIHAGIGGHHAAARALVSKAFRTVFYWPRWDSLDALEEERDVAKARSTFY